MMEKSLKLIRQTALKISEWEGKKIRLDPVMLSPSITHEEYWMQRAERVAAQVNGVDREMMISKCRLQECVFARNMIAHYLRGRGVKLKRIGELIGGRDHTTIINSLSAYKADYKNSESFRAKADKFTKEMGRVTL